MSRPKSMFTLICGDLVTQTSRVSVTSILSTFWWSRRRSRRRTCTPAARKNNLLNKFGTWLNMLLKIRCCRVFSPLRVLEQNMIAYLLECRTNGCHVHPCLDEQQSAAPEGRARTGNSKFVHWSIAATVWWARRARTYPCLLSTQCTCHRRPTLKAMINIS